MTKARDLYNDSELKREIDIEEKEDFRPPFRKDYGRLVHSPAFRRLQGKTQLFPTHESDTFRNRMTHSIEVSQIAKSIAIKLNRNEPFFENQKIKYDLVEMAALAHDLGHPPFGHDGEKELNRLMYYHGGFESNAQVLRILTKLEKKEKYGGLGEEIKEIERDRKGLNLTYRSIASVLKYDRVLKNSKMPYPILKAPANEPKIKKGYYDTEKKVVEKVKKSVLQLEFCGFISLIPAFSYFLL
ncbi:MAG: dGTP triphosphohydrolase, partial [Nanoarchaeota archaeon]